MWTVSDLTWRLTHISQMLKMNKQKVTYDLFFLILFKQKVGGKRLTLRF